MTTVNIAEPLVSVDWLQSHLGALNLVILDASIPKVTASNHEINQFQIPKARFFDLKNEFSDVSAPFPTTFPSSEQFTKSAQELGINRDSAIVVYDDLGIYSSPRAWWLFKAFGHDQIAVLDGGFPLWKRANYEVESKREFSGKLGNFKAMHRKRLMKFFKDVKGESQDRSSVIIDARSEARFKSKVPEPRAGLRRGTIPNSVNIPHETLLNELQFLTKEELKVIFNKFAKTDDNLTFSCGSGITACVLALGAEMAGYKNLSVYDGSWTEWGSLVYE